MQTNNFTKLQDGTIIFIRGVPPKELDGYDVDPKNPKRFLPKIPECKYRNLKNVKLLCGKLKGYYYCDLKQYEVSRLFCSQCKDYEA